MGMWLCVVAVSVTVGLRAGEEKVDSNRNPHTHTQSLENIGFLYNDTSKKSLKKLSIIQKQTTK